MLFRNGTHLVDGVCFFAESDPEWVFAELEPGYDHYDRYLGDGGRDPATDPAASGFIHFRNGVRAFVNVAKGQYPDSFRFQVFGETGLIEVHNSRVIRRGRETTEFFPLPSHQLTGIPACVAELIDVIENGGDLLSPAREAKKTVEVLVGFLQSHARGNVRVDLPLPPGALRSMRAVADDRKFVITDYTNDQFDDAASMLGAQPIIRVYITNKEELT